MKKNIFFVLMAVCVLWLFSGFKKNKIEGVEIDPWPELKKEMHP